MRITSITPKYSSPSFGSVNYATKGRGVAPGIEGRTKECIEEVARNNSSFVKENAMMKLLALGFATEDSKSTKDYPVDVIIDKDKTTVRMPKITYTSDENGDDFYADDIEVNVDDWDQDLDDWDQDLDELAEEFGDDYVVGEDIVIGNRGNIGWNLNDKKNFYEVVFSNKGNESLRDRVVNSFDIANNRYFSLDNEFMCDCLHREYGV